MSFFEEIKRGVPLGDGRIIPWETPVEEISTAGALHEDRHLAWVGLSLLDNEATIRVLSKPPTTIGWFKATLELENEPSAADYEHYWKKITAILGAGEQDPRRRYRCRWAVDGGVEVVLTIQAPSEFMGGNEDLIVWVKKLD